MWDCEYLTSLFLQHLLWLVQFNEWAAHFNVVLWATTDSQSDLKGPPDLKKSNPNQQGTRALFRVVSLL